MKEFRVVCTGIVTNQGDILIGKKEDESEHPVSGEWHLVGGYLEEDEEVREAVKREIEEETGLNVEVHQLLDIYRKDYEDRDSMVRVIFHCESSNRSAEPSDDLTEAEWVEPSELEKYLETDLEVVEREEISNFVEKLEKMPAF